MVANTTMKTLTNAWEQVSVNDATECSITLEGNRALPAVVRVAASAPSVDTGHTLTALHRSLAVNGLLPAQKVWARALNGSATLAIS